VVPELTICDIKNVVAAGLDRVPGLEVLAGRRSKADSIDKI